MINSIYSNMNDSTTRKIISKVELYNGSTLLNTFKHDNNLQSVDISRLGAKGKFFGFGICQQATVNIVDRNREINIEKGQVLKVYFSAEEENYIRICPSFYIHTVERDEITNALTVTAYDLVNEATLHEIRELGLVAPYTIKNVVEQISSFLGLSVNITDSAFDTEYSEGANLSGDETLRSVLDSIAEVTQTIYFINHNEELVFKRLDKSGEADLVINKNAYFELKAKNATTITNIGHSTELGDNVSGTDNSGVIQYVRDNPFWNMRNDISELLTAAIERVSGLTINQFNLKWRGNFLLELGDKIRIATKDDSYIDTYVLDDSIKYTGGLSESTSWEYTPESNQMTSSNPVTVGEKLNQTFAKVDKVKREISLVAQETADNANKISSLIINTDEISATVTTISKEVEDSNTINNERINELTKEVSLKVDADAVNISINKALEEGVDKVKTSSKNYTFDDTGLNISSSDSEFNTEITEDGMRIYKHNTEVLTANNEGVTAADLHAKTFLIIGENSRLEDRGNRTACFWIGPAGG